MPSVTSRETAPLPVPTVIAGLRSDEPRMTATTTTDEPGTVTITVQVTVRSDIGLDSPVGNAASGSSPPATTVSQLSRLVDALEALARTAAGSGPTGSATDSGHPRAAGRPPGRPETWLPAPPCLETHLMRSERTRLGGWLDPTREPNRELTRDPNRDPARELTRDPARELVEPLTAAGPAGSGPTAPITNGTGAVTASAATAFAARIAAMPSTAAEDPARARAALWIRTETREVHRYGRPVHLTRREFDLLEFLIRNPRRVFRRSQLLRAVWGHETLVGGERTVDVHIRRLRAKLGDGVTGLVTLRGVGYRLDSRPGVGVVLDED